MKDEYEKLMKLLEESEEGASSSLEEILKRAVNFFETLRKTFPSAEKEEKDEIIQMVNTLKKKLDEVAKKTAEKAGLSQDKLYEVSEDPSNYTPEQWHLMQETKRKLYDSARQLSSSMEEKRRAEGKAVTEETPREKRPLRKVTRRSPRKKWMKS